MSRIFKYIIVSIIMGVTVFYAVYYTKGEYNYMAIPTAFLINGPIYFSRKKTQFSKLTFKNKWDRLWNFTSGAFIIGGESLYLKGVAIMDEKIEIKKQDFYEMMYLMEKILYIAERSGAREDSDNNAYSLAITFGKENVVQELLSLRRNMDRYLDERAEEELEKILESIDDITIPYDLTLEALRKEIEPYLPKRVEG